jgi:transposase
MSDLPLFPELPEAQAVPPPPPVSLTELRLSLPVRNQVEMVMRDLDSSLDPEHPARAIWALVERLDLSQLYHPIRAAADTPGRAATDPKVLLALWLYATVEGIGSAHQLDRLSREHDAFRWLRGGVPLNYHMLSDFRGDHEKVLDHLLTDLVAVLLKEEVVKLKRVAQDGVRVRASAGGSSFRGEKTLRNWLKQAQEQVERLAKEREHPDPLVNRREQAARERAARERVDRVEEALRQLPAVQAVKERQKRHAGQKRAAKVTEARVSTTDPDARVMKMADGGFRPAHNVQFATDTASGIIVGVGVTNQGADQGQALPMAEQVIQRTGRQPEAYLLDGGFVDLEDIRWLEERGVVVYAPPKEGQKPGACLKESAPVRVWRQRMATKEGKEIYKERAATAEWVNAQARGRYGLQQFRVRGLSKVRCVALLMALAHNLCRWLRQMGEAERAALLRAGV